ncbi:MAG: HlyD family type I secretion periplasmic adaptor subunit [Pseudomonadota bacterium]
MASTDIIDPNQPLPGGPSNELAPTDAEHRPARSRAGRLGWGALWVGIAGFVLWALFAPLDEGVPAHGSVAMDTKRKAVQHLSGGIVKEVLVTEGKEVQEGQLLLRLDDGVAKANFQASRQRYLMLLATQARLKSEQAGRDAIEWHPELVAASKEDALIQLQMTNQQQLLRTRRSGLQADLQSIKENISGQEALILAYQGMLASRRSQLALLNDELTQTRGLVKEGYAPRNRQLELERMVAESNASSTELIGNITRARQAIAEVRQRAISREQEYRKEVETQAADVNRDVQSEVEKYRALQDDLGRTQVRAPASGQVVGLNVQTVGGVIGAGQKLMDIVPEKEPLLLEARVMPHLIDRVHADMPVDVRFSSFAHSPQLVVEGKVVSISGDLLTDQATNTQYYLARVSITPQGMKELGKRTLQPGMPVEVVFKTGERTLLTYLLHPLTKRMAASMKEE